MNKVPVTPLGDGIYLLNEFDGTNCYLVVGSEKALLIDCGTGFADLRGTAESLCDVPVICAATHGHVDHVGGAGQFEAMYLHEDDCKPFTKLQMSVAARKLFLSSNGAIKAHGFTAKDVRKGKYKTKLLPMKDGDTIDLGDRVISVHHTPGHTKGSVALIDEASHTVFSGDNVCDALWMHLPGSTSLEEWLPSAQWLYEISKTHRVFWGHRTPQLTTEYIGTVIEWGKEIIRSHPKNSLLPQTKQYPPQSDGILYRTDNIHTKG